MSINSDFRSACSSSARASHSSCVFRGGSLEAREQASAAASRDRRPSIGTLVLSSLSKFEPKDVASDSDMKEVAGVFVFVAIVTKEDLLLNDRPRSADATLLAGPSRF